jgi:LPXTG-motif cell wall-anchored protein
VLAGAGFGAIPAFAAAGDVSHASAQYLGGSLLALDTDAVASLGGETATSTGTADQTNANNLNLTALGAISVTSPGGVQIPIDLGGAGVVEQYASALQNGSSVGASGLTSATGDIGTGVTPAPGVAPGPLHVNLGTTVDSLNLPAADELAQLDLTVDAAAARAAQAAPAAATGAYALTGAQLQFQSPTVAALGDAIRDQVTNVQAAVDALGGTGGTLATSLDGLVPGGGVDAAVTVAPIDLSATVAPLLAGTISGQGVTLDLATGAVTVDLGAVTALEGRAPSTELLTDAVITDIGNRISAVAGTLTTSVTNALRDATADLAVTADVTQADSSVITIDSTLGGLLGGSQAGIGVTDLPLTPADIVLAVDSPLAGVGTAITNLGPAVLAPVTGTLVPALQPVLSRTLSLMVNNQDTAGGVFTETALRATVLPGPDALVLNVASASVGPNALAGPPTITGLTPTSGPEDGGTVVTITGTGLIDATGATFDGIPGTDFTVIDDTTATVASPPHAAGPVDVVVQDPSGESGPAAFTYVAAPVIAGVDPGEGPATGGTPVTITGTGFTGTTAVTFGGTPAAGFTVVDDATITATTPAHAPAAVDVVVTAIGGASAPGDFTFLPAVTGVVPGNGPETGGTPVTITGTGFTGATDVTFDGSPATDVVVVNDTTITAVTPAGIPGTADVVVEHPVGDSLPGTFVYDVVPDVTGIAPNHGPQTGGTPVTISGTGFTGSTGVTFDGAPGTAFTVVNDGTITVTTPAGLPGPADVVVQHPNGASLPGLFTYDVVPAAPVITGLDPDHGPYLGGTDLTISGSGFTGATGVTIGGTPVPGFTVVNDTTITVTTPPHAVGTVPVVVTTPVGPSPAVPFVYDAGTTVDGVDPAHGPQAGGTTVTITGGCFTGATAVLFGSTPATSFTILNDATITAVTPAGTGRADVTVVGTTACGNGTRAGAFQYDDPMLTATSATGMTGAGLASTGSDDSGMTLLAGIALLLVAVGASILIRRRRTAA